jgi:hypothetical protein
LKENNNKLENITLTKTRDKFSRNELLSLSLSFKINGNIRSSFNQSTWEKAYNKFDNTFRITIKVDLKSERKIIHSTKFMRKGIFFWTRNPKISHRIWISIVKDDSPFYPLSEEESRNLLFDINKLLEVQISHLKKGIHKVHADLTVSWGRHNFAQPMELKGRSNQEEIEIIN